MSAHVCLIAESDSRGEPEKLLRRCGLTVLRFERAAAWREVAPKRDVLLVVADLPADEGLRELKALRAMGVGWPAILVAQPGFVLSAQQREEAGVLEVMPRPIAPRAFLGWIECVCAAHLALAQRRSAAVQRPTNREESAWTEPRAVHQILRALG